MVASANATINHFNLKKTVPYSAVYPEIHRWENDDYKRFNLKS